MEENEKRRSASRVHLRYESAGLRTVRIYIIILDAGYTYLYKEGFTYIPRAGIRYGIFMAYCNALGNFVINVRNGEERKTMIARLLRAFRSFYQILFVVHNCLTLLRMKKI